MAQVPPLGLPVRCSSLYPFTRSGSLRNSAYITLLILFVPPRGWCFLRPCHELQVILSSQQTRNSVSQLSCGPNSKVTICSNGYFLGSHSTPMSSVGCSSRFWRSWAQKEYWKSNPGYFCGPPPFPHPKKFSPLMPKIFMPIPRGAGTLFGTILGVSEE